MENKAFVRFVSVILCIMLMHCPIISFGESTSCESYPKITAAKMCTELEKASQSGHPYLFADKADFQKVKLLLSQSDGFISSQYQKIKVEAANFLSLPPKRITADINNESYFSRGTDAIEIVLNCSFVYLIEGNEEYAQRAYDEALYFASLTSWGTYQYIDNNQAALAVAICYDWLYDWLGTEEGRREALAASIWSNHLNQIYSLFKDPDKPEYNSGFFRWYFGSNNHAALDNAYTFLTALAVSETSVMSSAEIMTKCLDNLQGVFDKLNPDGGWYEGVSYWNNVGPSIGKLLSSMNAAFGTCFGYEDIPHIINCPYFPIYSQSAQGNFVYADGVQSPNTAPEIYYFGKISGNSDFCSYIIRSDKASPLLCLWYDNNTSGESGLKKDYFFSNISLATMRSSHTSEQSVFAAMSVQDASNTHAYMNSGTFVLDALGERWVTNPGRDSYTLDGYWDSSQNGKRWQYYNTRAEANSCVVINPSEDGGQNISAGDKIDAFESGSDGAFCISDLTKTYNGAQSYKRGLKLYDSRSRVVLRDEIVLEEESDVYSFINIYKSDIAIVSDGAILSKGNKKIYVKIKCDTPYKLKIMEASPLLTSPNPDGQKDFTGDFKRLAICFDGVGGFNLNVEFIPFFADDIPSVFGHSDPLELWTNSDYSPAYPALSGLNINGNPLKNFDPENHYYKVYLPEFEAQITPVSSDNVNIKITSDFYNSCYLIYLTDKLSGKQSVYLIDVGLSGEIVEDSFIGGSISSADYVINQNYGSSKYVLIRDNSRYSLMAYYKIKLPLLPQGKQINRITLVLNQYRKTESENPERFEFYLVDPSSWDENTITYNSAPLRHKYAENWYPFEAVLSDGSYGDAPKASVSFVKDEIPKVSRSLPSSDDYYVPVNYDITGLSETVQMGNGYISFAIGVSNVGYRTLATNYIASKDCGNPELMPQVQIDISNTPDSGFIGVSDVDIVNISDDKYYSQTYIVNNSSQAKEFSVYVAMYDEENTLLKLDTTNVFSYPKMNELFLGNIFSVPKKTFCIKAFVFDLKNTPMIYPEKIIKCVNKGGD